MIALIQRVSSARVEVAGEVTGAIERGLLVLLGVEKGDDEAKLRRLVERVAGYRVFGDENGKMNLNVQQAGGSLLVVSQFTLPADTKKGMRPSFSSATPPELGEAMYHRFVEQCREKGLATATGRYAANMQVHLVNDGPVTFWLQT